jgi:hypothetical protein
MPAAIPTVRGPTRLIQRPPRKAAKPKTRIAIENVKVTSEIDHPNFFINGSRKTLQA